MTSSRPPKKTETLEIRLPHASKAAFMERCRAAGLTASEVVRDLIESTASPPDRDHRHPVPRLWQALAVASAGVVIGAVAAPSIAQALPGTRAAFQQMDANKDGVVTFSEFEAR